MGGAYLTFEEDRKGSIEDGKLADLAVLTDDPLTCAEDDLKDIKAETTNSLRPLNFKTETD